MEDFYIDFHAHILPGADHGSSCVSVSEKQLAMARKARISHIVATPHYYPDRHSARDFFVRRNAAFKELSAIPDRGVEIILGAEVMLCNGLQNLPELELLCVGKSGTILIEMPYKSWTKKFIDTLIRIKAERSLNIILAHVERYEAPAVEELFSLGLRGQINAAALKCPLRRRRIFGWIDRGSVIALGSDIHGTGGAYRDYSRAVRLLGERGRILQQSMKKIICEKERIR